MAEIEYTALEEADNFDAASINSRFTTVVDGINDLEEHTIQENALRAEHFSGISTVAGAATQDCVQTTFRTYTNTFNTWNVVTNGVNNLELLALGIDFTTVNLNRVLVLVNLNIRDILETATPETQNSDWSAGVRIELQYGNPLAWVPLEHTRRFVSKASDTSEGEPSSRITSLNDVMDIDVPIRCLVGADDIAVGDVLAGVRVAVTLHDASNTYPGGWEFRVGTGNLTVIPLYCDDP